MCKIHNKSSNYTPNTNPPVTSLRQIEKLVRGFKEGNQFETLLGVTGSVRPSLWRMSLPGSTKPTLVLAHNKTLAAQLYGEMKEFFPENAVEYFVSYYDYYQLGRLMSRPQTPI